MLSLISEILQILDKQKTGDSRATSHDVTFESSAIKLSGEAW